MQIGCWCGQTIIDITDFVPWKARFVHDRDWPAWLRSATEAREPRVDHTFMCYQCWTCGRLLIDDARRQLVSFIPEGPVEHLLGSVRGLDWRGGLIGHWYDHPYTWRDHKGDVFSDAEDEYWEKFDDWDAMRAAYDALFERLSGRDRLRSAFLTVNGAIVHSWSGPSAAGDTRRARQANPWLVEAGYGADARQQCPCGATATQEPWKAHLIADRDWFDFLETAGSPYGPDFTLVRCCYQCPACGRCWIDDPARPTVYFVPRRAKDQVLAAKRRRRW
jgi:hypothetical protein